MDDHPKTSRLAIASLVLSLLFFIPLVPALLAAVFGLAAMRRIRRSHGELTGYGLALAGNILGIFVLLLSLWAADFCREAYNQTSVVADAVLRALGEGNLAPAIEHLARTLSGDDLLALDQQSQQVNLRLGPYQHKRWGWGFALDQRREAGLGLRVRYLATFGQAEREVPVHMSFVSEDRRWKLGEVWVERPASGGNEQTEMQNDE
jgi:hypothetical protein